MIEYKVVDLFAGAGGLSLGFMQTKKYEIKVAFENSPYMQDTYRENHPGVEVLGDVCTADYSDIKKRHGDIDVVIGGPPCQGFSNANRQKNHAISQNNMLVKQYLRAILELQPKAFVMENVSMLRSEVHRFYMEQRDLDIVSKCRIPVKNTPLQLLDAEFVFDGALRIVQNRELIEKYIWPEDDYSLLNVIYKASKNPAKLSKALEKHQRDFERIADAYIARESQHHIMQEAKSAFDAILKYYSGHKRAEDLKRIIEPSIMIQRMLSKSLEIFDNSIVVDAYKQSSGIIADIRSFAVFDYLKGILESPENDYVIESDVLCAADYGAPQKRMRFVVVGIKREISEQVSLPNAVPPIMAKSIAKKLARILTESIKSNDNAGR